MSKQTDIAPSDNPIAKHLGRDCICKYLVINNGVRRVIGSCVFSNQEKRDYIADPTPVHEKGDV